MAVALKPAQADALVLLAAFFWGISFYFQKEAMRDIGPFLFTGLRAVIAALALLPLAFREMKEAAGSIPVTRYAVLGGVVFLFAGALQQTGIATATLTNTSFLTALYVVITPFLLWLSRNEKPGLRVWSAAALAFAGIWCLGGGSIGAFSRGDMLIAASSLFWSLYMVVTSAAARLGKPCQYTCLQFAVVAALALPLAWAFEPLSGSAIKAAAVPVLYVGIVASAVTYTLVAHAVRHMPASRASVLLSTEVLFGAGAGFVMHGERLGMIGIIGAGAVMAAVLLVQTGRTPAAS